MYAFFLDIDGTTLHNGQMSPAVAEAIERAQSMGHRVFINTARGYHGAQSLIRNFPFDGISAAYGTMVFARGGWLDVVIFSDEAVYDIAKYCFDNGLEADFLTPNLTLSVNPTRTPRIALKSAEDIKERYPLARFSKITIMGEPKAEVAGYMAKWCEVFRLSFCLDLVPIGSTKATGMKALLDQYGIDEDHTVAIGDTHRDLDMIRFARYGIGMGNGDSVLLGEVEYITKPVSEDGVAYAIDCIISGETEKMRVKR